MLRTRKRQRKWRGKFSRSSSRKRKQQNSKKRLCWHEFSRVFLGEMKSTVSMKRPTVNRNNDLAKLKAKLTETIATIVQIVLWMWLRKGIIKEGENMKDQMTCQQNVRHWGVFGVSAMPQYEYSGQISQKSQPIRRPVTAIEAKSTLGQVKKSPTTKRIASRSTERSTRSEELTAANPVVSAPINKISSYIAAGSPTISSSFLGSFAGASLALIMFLIALAVVWLLFRCIRTAVTEKWKKNRRYDRMYDTGQPERLNEETSDGGSNNDCLTATNSSDPLTTANLKNTKLSELPPDLEDLLVKKLDVRCKGERRYGWQKVGAAFKIPSDDLKYLSIEYKRDNGSPTSKLLSILGISKGKTVSDLVNVLQSPKVNLPDVAILILYITIQTELRGLGE